MIPVSEKTVLDNMSGRLEMIESAISGLRTGTRHDIWSRETLEKEKNV